MIKINLIPEEERKKVKKIKFKMPSISVPGFDLILSIIFLVVAVVGILFLNNKKSNELASKKEQISTAQEKLKKLQKEKKIVENIQQRQQRLTKWINLVKDLNEGRALPVHIFNELNRIKPDYMWFNSFEESQSNFRLTGKTFSNLIISNFMVNLRQSSYFSNISLVEVNESKEKEQSIMGFTLTGKIPQ